MTLTAHKLPHDDGNSTGLDYNRLPEPWREWAKLARNFIWQLDDNQDREDLFQNIIVRLAEVAEVYRQRGLPFHRGACIKTAQYTRLRFYHQQKRWKRVFSLDLNSVIKDEDGYQTELAQLILDEKGIDQDTWLDFKLYYRSRPEKERRTIRKLVKQNWRNLSGYDYKLIRRFKAGAQTALA